jgi:hypothetical protein
MKTTIDQDPPGFMKLVVATGTKMFNYEGKLYRPRNPFAWKPEDRPGDPFQVSQEECRFLISQRLADLAGGGLCEVRKWPDGFPSYTSWKFASRPDDAFTRAVYLQQFNADLHNPRPPGFRLRVYVREVLLAGGGFRYCSQAELKKFLDSDGVDVGTDGLEGGAYWPPHISYKLKGMRASEEQRCVLMIAGAAALAVAILTFCGWAAFVLSPH